MKSQYHVLSGGIAGLLLIPVLGVNSAIFWASSVLIDGDHYLDYLYRNGFKDFSVKRMFTFYELLSRKRARKDFVGLNVLHTVEFLLLVYIASALTSWIWLKAVFWGMLFHMVFDLGYLYWQGRLFRRAFSIIEYVVRWNRMKRQGLRPQITYQSTLKSMCVGYRSSED
ncbi:hypothetical protein ACFLUF_02930 [Chloroflexota bacterium]